MAKYLELFDKDKASAFNVYCKQYPFIQKIIESI